MKRLFLAIPMCLFFLISACTEETNQMQRELEGILKKLQEFEAQVVVYEDQLANLERKEQILFEKTVDFNIEDRELIESGVSRLETYLEKREQLLDAEQEIINNAKEAAETLTTLTDPDDEKGTLSVSRLDAALTERYELHNEVIELYKELMVRQGTVYELLIEENVKRVELEEATVSVNNQRGKLEDAIRAFNHSTLEVNGALKETQQAEAG